MLGNSSKPKQEISVTDGQWKIVTSTTVSKVVLEFELDKEFDETTADGRKVKVGVSYLQGRLVLRIKDYFSYLS